MAKNENIIEKSRKYMFQFPGNVNSEKQKEYLDKVEEKFKTERFVSISPEIKIYPESDVFQKQMEAKKEEEKKEEAKNDDTSNKDTKKDDAGKTPDKNPEADKGKADDTPAKDADKGSTPGIEKVVVPSEAPPAADVAATILVDDALGREGGDNEQ